MARFENVQVGYSLREASDSEISALDVPDVFCIMFLRILWVQHWEWWATVAPGL